MQLKLAQLHAGNTQPQEIIQSNHAELMLQCNNKLLLDHTQHPM